VPDTPAASVPFYKSHRFWSTVVAAGGACTTVVSTVASINPILGVSVKVAGVVLTVIGAIGMAYFGGGAVKAAAKAYFGQAGGREIRFGNKVDNGGSPK